MGKVSLDECDEAKCNWLEAHDDPKVRLMGRLLRKRLEEQNLYSIGGLTICGGKKS